WLIVAGDVAERTDEIRWSLDLLRRRFNFTLTSVAAPALADRRRRRRRTHRRDPLVAGPAAAAVQLHADLG
ncbi:hypothetical protein GR254_25100, partial [Mycobacterium tuberculosis]|nr:hypothetical protein [Mycobacterium tuberculosis]